MFVLRFETDNAAFANDVGRWKLTAGSASAALQQIMAAESAEEWKPCTNGAEILLPEGEWLWVSPQRIAEAAREIELGDEVA